MDKILKTNAQWWVLPLIAALYIVARIMPHMANFSPQIVFILLLSFYRSRLSAFLAIAVATVLSDFLMSFIYGYPIFGTWSVFTYSGIFIVALLNFRLWKDHFQIDFLSNCFFGALLYWLWTNFGTWALSGLYPHSLNGLMLCYYFAIPFLKYSLLATMGLAAVTMLSLRCYPKAINSPN
jgi:hypothetical protein